MVSIIEFYTAFIQTGKAHSAPEDMLTDIQRVYERMMSDGVWKSPEQLYSHQVAIKQEMASVVQRAADGSEPWCVAMRGVYESMVLSL